MEEFFIKLALEELENPKFEVTKQYLKAFDLVRSDNIIQVERIDLELDKDSVIVYFPIKDKKFFLEIYVNKDSPEVSWISIESGNSVFFRATSVDSSFQELVALTNLSPLTGWNKGDLMLNTSEARYKFSALHFDPFPSLAYPLEHKLKLLLKKLSKDHKGIKTLIQNHNGIIAIATYMYVSQPGGIHLDKALINELQDLGLEVDIDMYVGGKEIEMD